MSLGNSSFGFSGGGGGGGVTPIIGGGTLNYLAKFTPDGTTIGNSLLFDNGTNVGVGTVLPTAKFHVLQNTIGTGAKAFKVDINTWGEVLNIDDNTYFNYRGLGANFDGGVNVISSGVYPSITFKYNSGTNTSGSLYGVGASMFLQAPTFGIGNVNFAVSASLHVQGVDATSGNFALKVDNSASSPLLYVRNDGNVGVGITPSLSDTKLDIKLDVNQRLLFRSVAVPTIGSTSIIQSINNLNTDVMNIVTLGLDWYHASRNNLFSNIANIIVPTAKVHIIGNNAASDLYALKVDNSTSSPILYARNDGFIGLGTSTWNSGLNTHYFEALSPISTGLGAGKTVTATFYSTNAYAQDLGGGIALGGKYNAGGAITSFGGINAVKLNSTDGDYSGRLNLWVSNLSTGNIAMTSVSYGSKIRNGMGTINPNALLHLDGDNADVFISEAKCINTTGYAGKFIANTVNTQSNVGIYIDANNGFQNYSIWADGGNAGFGGINATAKMYVKGIDSTSSNYALKVDNSATSPLFHVRNDGNVGIGTASPISRLHIYTDNNDITGQSGQLINNVNAGISAAAALFFRNNDNKGFEIGVVSSTHTTYQDTYGAASDSFYTSVINGGNLIFKQRTVGKGIKFFNAGNGVITGQSSVNVSDNGTGFYTDTISAIVHVRGIDSTSTNYALKVDNSASSPLLYVRNDGFSTIHGLNIGRGSGGVITNSAFGFNALNNNITGAFNTAVGYISLESNTGERNSGFGYGSLSANTSGVRNTALGMFAGNVNTIGDDNLFIGYNANPSANNLTNAIAIGYNASVSVSNAMVLGSGVNVGIGTSAPTAKLQVVGLAEYADNAAASGAGLTVGAFYRTGDILKVVH